MKFEIKSRWDSKILFTAEAASLLLALEAAIKAGVNLFRANLCGARSKLGQSVLGQFVQRSAALFT